MSPLLYSLLLATSVRWATPDYDQDGQVGICDLLLLLERWGPCTDACCPGDINRDGRVGEKELLIVLEWWGAYTPTRWPWCQEG